MATITSQNISEVGIAAPVMSDANVGGDQWENSGSEFLMIKNGGGETTVVTFTAEVTSFDSPNYGPATKASRTFTITTGNTGVIGPFVPAAFNNATGYCSISYTIVTSVTLAIFTI